LVADIPAGDGKVANLFYSVLLLRLLAVAFKMFNNCNCTNARDSLSLFFHGIGGFFSCCWGGRSRKREGNWEGQGMRYGKGGGGDGIELERWEGRKEEGTGHEERKEVQ
jgi:hypothetical protein